MTSRTKRIAGYAVAVALAIPFVVIVFIELTRGS